MIANSQDILVVDDEAEVCELIRLGLARRGLKAHAVHNAEAARELLRDRQFGAMVADIVMPGTSGFELMQLVRQEDPKLPVVLITAIATVEGAKQAIRDGAFEYLEKPFDVNRLCDVIQQALTWSASKMELPARDAQVSASGIDSITGLMTLRRLHERLTEIRLSSIADRRNCAVLLINIDDFDEVNRLFGYAFGDEVLRQMAQRICAKCGTRVPVAHCQADEFAILLPEADEHSGRNLAEQLLVLVRRLSLAWKGHPINITACAAVAEAGSGFAVAESELLDRARRAMAVAKRFGGNTVCTYSQTLQEDETAVALAAEEMSRLAEQTAKVNRRLRFTCLESVRALTSAVEAKDPYTHRHSEQVAYYAERLARFAALPGDVVEVIRVASLVHDIGKIGIPDTVLTKPGKLTDQEFQLIKQHPTTGANILEKISLLTNESTVVRHHHENWDGSGYPAGLAGEQIPLASRIVNIADSIDAMLMRRTYKSPYTVEKVLYELQHSAGRQFDPAFAAAAVEWMTKHADELILANEPAVVA